MRYKKKDKKVKVREASNAAVLASVTEEMARPRMAESVHIRTDKQAKLARCEES
jgi:hypothetical protein